MTHNSNIPKIRVLAYEQKNSLFTIICDNCFINNIHSFNSIYMRKGMIRIRNFKKFHIVDLIFISRLMIAYGLGRNIALLQTSLQSLNFPSLVQLLSGSNRKYEYVYLYRTKQLTDFLFIKLRK